MKSSGSPPTSLWRARSTWVIAAATGAVSELTDDTVMSLMCWMPCSFFCTVVYGANTVSS